MSAFRLRGMLISHGLKASEFWNQEEREETLQTVFVTGYVNALIGIRFKWASGLSHDEADTLNIRLRQTSKTRFRVVWIATPTAFGFTKSTLLLPSPKSDSIGDPSPQM